MEWVHGPSVPQPPLAEGLRQGCVLSPILYCIFINCFLAKPPQDVGLPACAEEVVQELFSQGIQGVDSDEAGVYNPSLGRSVQAFLFMDATRLLARTKVGLKTLTKGYMNFCRKFRMRLNHGKSKVMHFRRRMQKEELDAGFQWMGQTFSSHQGPLRQESLRKEGVGTHI